MSILMADARPRSWRTVPFIAVAGRVQEAGYPDLEALSVYLDQGVVPRASREDNHNQLGADLARYQRVLPGDIVFNKLRTWQGGFGVSAHEGIVSPAYIVCRRSSDLAEPRFLHHVLRSEPYLAELKRLSKWMPPSQFDISWESIKSLPLWLPDTDEQRRIAEFLDDQVTRIDQIVRARASQTDQLDEYEKTELRRLVSGGWVEASREPIDAPWVGPVPPSASLAPLARIVLLQRGVDLTEDEREGGPFPVVTTAGIVGTHSRSVVAHSGVVVGRYGSVGSVYWIHEPHWPHNTTLYVRDYRGNRPRWVYYLLRSYPWAMLQARSAVPGVNRNDMSADLMALLPLQMQDQAVERLDEMVGFVDEGRRRLAAASIKMRELKRSLISAAVLGEFDVSSASGLGVPL